MTPASSEAAAAPRPVPLGLVGFLATTVMLFTAFVASYLVRRTGADWHPVPIPAIAWVNLLALAGASATLELARRAADERTRGHWLWGTILLGILFLLGQLQVWSSLAAAGVFVGSNPQAAFVYVLTGLHGLHLAGGLAALFRAAARPETLGACAFYWHAIGVIWLLVLIVLSAA